jgi:hypothetical protein
VREAVELLRGTPFLVHRDDISGFTFDVETGRLTRVV